MEYYLEIYLDVNSLCLFGIEEQYVSWEGVKCSQDPPVYASGSGLKLEKVIGDSFKLATGEDLPKDHIGLALKGDLIYALSRKINMNTDAYDPIIDLISNLDSKLSYILLLCRVDERVSECCYVKDNDSVIDLIKDALNWDNHKDIVIHKEAEM